MKKLAAGVALASCLLLGSCTDVTTVGKWKVDPLASGTTLSPGSGAVVRDTSGNGHHLAAPRLRWRT